MLAILCCVLDSRGDQHQSLIDSAKEKCANADVLIYREFQELATVERYIRAYEKFRNRKYTHYMFGASDIVIDTEEFDTYITGITNQAEKDAKHRCFVLYPDDGVHGITLCTHPIFTQEFLNATGEFFPSGYMRHCFVDNYVMHITKKTGTLLFCPTLKIIHNHPLASNGKWGIMDDHYSKVYEKSYSDEDLRLFEKCMIEHVCSNYCQKNKFT